MHIITKYFSASIFVFLMTLVWAVVAVLWHIPFWVFLLVLFAMDVAVAYFVVQIVSRYCSPPTYR